MKESKRAEQRKLVAERKKEEKAEMEREMNQLRALKKQEIEE